MVSGNAWSSVMVVTGVTPASCVGGGKVPNVVGEPWMLGLGVPSSGKPTWLFSCEQEAFALPNLGVCG